MSSQALAWIGCTATIVFGLLSIHFYVRSRRVSRLACLVGTLTLQRRTHPDVKISFRGSEVENLSRMLVLIWNSGTVEVLGSSVPDGNWPTLALSGQAHVLSVAVVLASSSYTGFAAHETGDHGVQFTFAYLNPGDGAIVEVLYESQVEAVSPPAFTAPLIGGEAPSCGEFPATMRKDVALSLLETAGGLLAGAAFAVWFSSKPVLAAVFIVAGLATLFTANYLDLRRLHRRLPAFARRYLKRHAA